MIDLKSLAHALRWRVTLDPSDADSPRSERPWMYRVEGRYGHIGVWGVEQLAVTCLTNRVRPRLLAVEGAKQIRDGDTEAVTLFPTGQLDTVCKILKARRRKVLTEEQRARLVEAGSATRLQAKVSRGRESFPAPDLAPDATDGPELPPDDWDAD